MDSIRDDRKNDSEADKASERKGSPGSSAPTTGINNDDTSKLVKSAVSSTLNFLSNASNETLGACLVGLGATTYLVLGRVGLIFIGAVGGIVLHASWDAHQGQGQEDDPGAAKSRRQTNSEIALRLLEWREAQKAEQDDDYGNTSNESEVSGALDFLDFGPETQTALNSLTDAVIQDYVNYWYDPVRPTHSDFPPTCRETFISFVRSFSSNLARKRPADTFLEFVTNSSSIVIVLLSELSVALSASPSSTAEQAVQAYLESHPQSSLANILDEAEQRRKLGMAATEVLDHFLDRRLLKCPPAQVFLKEVLANSIFESTLQRCCKNDWINGWIEYLLKDGEPELLNVIDEGVEQSTAQQSIPVKPSQVSEGALEQNLTTALGHKRNVSKAEDAMEEAMREAQRLTQLIAEDDAKRNKESTLLSTDDTSDDTNTHGIQTPASSQSDLPTEDMSKTTQAMAADPRSSLESTENITVSNNETKTTAEANQATPSHSPTASREEARISPKQVQEVLTLHKANFMIFDDSDPNDKRPLKSKPIVDYMIQIEPQSSSFGGWMIARTYNDFEKLHEVLRRISAISGASGFIQIHNELPLWRSSTKPELTRNLEQYLKDAVQFEQLAESEGMKRFLEKNQAVSKSPAAKNPFLAGQAAIENVGKGMFDVLSKAPKGVADGGKAVFGGMTSVLGGGQPSKKQVQSLAASSTTSTPVPVTPSEASSRLSMSSVPRTSTSDLAQTDIHEENKTEANNSTTSLPTSEHAEHAPTSTSGADLLAGDRVPPTSETPKIKLPPLPSDIPDNYASPSEPREEQSKMETHPTTPLAEITPILDASAANATAEPPRTPATSRKTRSGKAKAPLSPQETQVAIELIFAVINELYMLSSAWNFRRTLLNAAKAYLLRPGNAQLDAIRALLQETVLDANTSDAGMATHIRKLRENSLPTEEELRGWPAELSSEESEALRAAARRLIVARGMPQALTSVMGAAASGEALGKVFDCLQIEKVARGLLFGMMLQAVRAVTQ